MNLAARQIPNEPCFNRSEKKLAVLGSLSCTLNIVKNPFDFCAGEICVDKKSRMFTDIVAEAFFFELFTKLGGTAALPNDSVVYRLAGLLIPYNCCFTLICYTYTGNIINVKITGIDDG